MRDKILGIISTITKIKLDELKTNMDTPKMWDSMSHIEIILSLENEFNISLTQDEIVELKTINKAISIVSNKVGNET